MQLFRKCLPLWTARKLFLKLTYEKNLVKAVTHSNEPTELCGSAGTLSLRRQAGEWKLDSRSSRDQKHNNTLWISHDCTFVAVKGIRQREQHTHFSVWAVALDGNENLTTWLSHAASHRRVPWLTCLLPSSQPRGLVFMWCLDVFSTIYVSLSI